MVSTSAFGGMAGAQPGQGGVFFLEGRYVVEIKRCLLKLSRKKALLYIVETIVRESARPERMPGMQVSWIANLSTQDAALGDIKGFLAACQGVDPANEAALGALFTDAAGQDISEATSEYSVSVDNPLAGVLVNLEAVGITTRKGTPFTLHKWSPWIEGQAPLAA